MGFLRGLSLLLAVALLGGATVSQVVAASAPEVKFTPASLPYSAHWSGISFNGQKIGFGHRTIRRDGDGFLLVSEMSLRFHFLQTDKRLLIRSRERLGADLSLQSFEAETEIDGTHLFLRGSREGSMLVTEVKTDGQNRTERHALSGPVFSTSVLDLLPLVEGMAVGRRYRTPIYDFEVRRLGMVEQEVRAYESGDLFQGSAFRVHTRFFGQEVVTWISEKGENLVETSADGVIVARREEEGKALAYLAESALNKSDALLDFSLIPLNSPIQNAERVRHLRIRLSGLVEGVELNASGIQSCHGNALEAVCDVGRQEGSVADAEADPSAMAATLAVPMAAPAVHAAAKEATEGATGDEQRVRALLLWIGAHVRQEIVDVFTALDVLEKRRAECQGHAYLYAAMARAQGIPTRVVNGIVYSRDHKGFLYHAWNESLVEGRWIAVDPTFRQFPADATHVRLLVGEEPSDLLPLANVIGRLRVEVLERE